MLLIRTFHLAVIADWKGAASSEGIAWDCCGFRCFSFSFSFLLPPISLAFHLAYIPTLYLSFYLAYILTFLLTFISKSIWYSILHIFCQSIWHFIWHLISDIFRHSIWHRFWHSIWHIFWHFIWHTVSHSIWHMFWHSIWRIFEAFYLTCILAFYLACILAFHLAVEVQRCSLSSGGPRLRSSGAHCSRLAVDVQDWRKRRKRRSGSRRLWYNMIQPSNPHLAGWETCKYWSKSIQNLIWRCFL